MTTRKKLSTAAVALTLAVAAVAVMWSRHQQQGSPAGQATRAAVGLLQPQMTDEAIAQAITEANLTVNRLTVRSFSGIVILQGSSDAASAEKAETLVKSLGFTRVANLIKPTAPIDDQAIRREAERQIAEARSLQGTTLTITCENGVLRVSGKVQHELQKDAARSVLRSISGASRVQVDLSL